MNPNPRQSTSRWLPDQSSVSSQATLFAFEPPPPEPFRKAVAAVHAIPKESMTLLQRKIQNALLKHATTHPRDPDGFWSLPSLRLRQEIDFNSNNTGHLKAACHALVSMSFDFDVLAGGERSTLWDIGNLFSRIQMQRDGVLRFKINEDIVEHLVKPSIYALIDMAMVRSFRSATSLALYEFVIRYEGIGQTAQVDFETLVGMLQGRAKRITSEQPKHFLYRRLRPAINEVNAVSGQVLTLHRTLSGPRGPMYRFTMVRKPRLAPEASFTNLSELEATAKLVSHGMHQRNARRLVQSHGPDACLVAAADLDRRMRDTNSPAVRNPSAFLFTLITNSPGSNRTLPPRRAIALSTGTFDIRASYIETRRQDALGYLREIDAESRIALAERYNLCAAPALRMGPRPGRAAVIAFSRWVAQDTWGDPSPDDLLTHAAALLSAGSR